MEESAEQIRELVEAILEPLVDYPEELRAESSLNGRNLLVEVSVNPEDAGKVIGRQGRVIKSIRTLARAAASRKGLNGDVELLD